MTHATTALDDDDAAFLARFEGAGFGAHEFPHRAHLRTAWLYVRRDGPEAAAEAVVAGIRRVAAAHGHPERYHDTITRAWVRVVALAAVRTGASTFDGLLAAHPELLDKRLLLRHYSAGVLGSPAARAGWVPPDLHPIPGPAAAA